MSRRKQRGPLLNGALDVLELPVPDLEAGGHQRKGGLQVFHRVHAITEQHACRTVEHAWDRARLERPCRDDRGRPRTAPRRSGVCRSVPVSITRAKATAASTLHRDVGAAGYVPVGGAEVPATQCDLAATCASVLVWILDRACPHLRDGDSGGDIRPRI